MVDYTESTLLEKAAKHIRGKEYQQALDVLVPYLRENQQSEQAWFLLSFALKDPHKIIYSLEKVIEINPENKRAEDRLKKIQEIISSKKKEKISENKPEKIPTHPKKRSLPWATYPLALFIIFLIGFVVIVKIFPTFSPRRTQTTVQTGEGVPFGPPSFTSTETEQPTLLPTNTPAVEILLPLTPTSPPLIATRDFDTPQGSLAQQMDDIQNQVATIRGLSILVDNPRYLIRQNEVYSIVSKIFSDNFSREDIRDQSLVLQSLGLIDPTYDLYSHMLGRIDEGFGGFYLPSTDEVFVIGENFSAIEKFVYAHEYDHALIDQQFHLEELGVYPLCKSVSDRCYAINALIEGDAVYLMYRWLEAYASEEDIAAIEKAQFTPFDEAISSNDFLAPYLIRDASFRYSDGRNFVEFLFERGGWDLVNQAYQDLPNTTEKIIHPEKYLSDENPIHVQLASIDHLLDNTWEEQDTGTLGELMTEMILGYNENYLVQIDPSKAANAASGWGGDQYQVFYQSRNNQILTVAMWAWDTLDDRNEFWEVISEHLNRRYFGKQIQETKDTCWTKINDHFSCIYKWNKQTLWITAPSMSLISQILAEYPNFK